MKKKIKSAGISIIIIVVLLLSILIGVKNGTIDKLTKEMPTRLIKHLYFMTDPIADYLTRLRNALQHI